MLGGLHENAELFGADKLTSSISVLEEQKMTLFSHIVKVGSHGVRLIPNSMAGDVKHFWHLANCFLKVVFCGDHPLKRDPLL